MSDLFDGYRYDLVSPPSRTQLAQAGSNTTFTNPTRAFHAQETGTIVVRYEDDAADVTLEVIRGAQYSGRLTHVRAASTVDVVGLW